MSREENMDNSSTSFKYDDICKIVGNLYLDSLHRIQTMETHNNSVIEHFRAQNSDLMQEVKDLQSELAKHNGI